MTLDTTGVTTTGTLNVGATTITGNVTASGTVTGASGSKLGNITISDGSITTEGTTISFGDKLITTTAALSLASGTNVADMTFTTGTIKSASGSVNFHDDNITTSGTFDSGTITASGNVTATGTVSGASGSQFGNVTLANGQITDSSKSISFSDNNIQTTGTAQLGATTITGSASVSAGLTVGTSATVGDVSISNGSITSTNANGINFGENNLSTNGSITSGDLTINGNLTVSGTTTTVESENVVVNDPLMVLSSGTVNNPVNDAGIIIERGNVDNVGLIWVEGTGNEYFAAVKTTADGNTDGSITTTGLTDMRVDNIIVGGSTLDNTTVDKLVGVTAGTVSANKTIITDGNSHIDVVKATEIHLGASGSETKVDSTAAEINLLNTASAGTITNGKAVIYGSSGEINAKTLKLDSVAVTASSADINKLTGLTVTGTELDQLSGITDGTATANKVLIPDINKNLPDYQL